MGVFAELLLQVEHNVNCFPAASESPNANGGNSNPKVQALENSWKMPLILQAATELLEHRNFKMRELTPNALRNFLRLGHPGIFTAVFQRLFGEARDMTVFQLIPMLQLARQQQELQEHVEIIIKTPFLFFLA